MLIDRVEENEVAFEYLFKKRREYLHTDCLIAVLLQAVVGVSKMQKLLLVTSVISYTSRNE